MRMLQPRVRLAKLSIAPPLDRVDPFYLSAEWKETRARVLARDGHRCVIPGCDRRAFICDHIVSRKNGGSDGDDNLRSLCVPMTMPPKKTTSDSAAAAAELIGTGGFKQRAAASRQNRLRSHAWKFLAGTIINGSMGHKPPVGRFFSPRPLVHRVGTVLRVKNCACAEISGDASMTAFNVVRFRVKPGREQEFLDAHRNVQWKWPGSNEFDMIRTGDRSNCVIGEWENTASIAAARPNMVATLNSFRDTLEGLGAGLGVTDPVSGPVVLEASGGGLGKTQRGRDGRSPSSRARNSGGDHGTKVHRLP